MTFPKVKPNDRIQFDSTPFHPGEKPYREIPMKIRLSTTLAALIILRFSPADLRSATFELDFSSSGGGILDAQGAGTGFPLRLTGTGGSLPANDPNLDLDTSTGKLTIRSGNGTGANQDFNGQAGLGTAEALGLQLSSLGYTGSGDFIVSASFDPPPGTAGYDQAGIFIGQNAANLTRAGMITFAGQEHYAVHTTGGGDNNGRFYGFGFNGVDGMDVTITRINRNWRYYVNNVEWQPSTDTAGNGIPVDPTGEFGSPNLQSLADLTVGVFAINVVNATSETHTLDNFRVVVDPVAGDANNDAVVDADDFFLIIDNMFTEVIPGTAGDVTFDGEVQFNDFRLWKNEAPPSALIAAGLPVPEPSALSLLVLAACAASCGRDQ